MCSIGEDDFGDEGGVHAMKEESPLPEGATTIEQEICRKCNDQRAVLKLNQKEPQCRECFLHYVRHKFRASLGATKIVRRGSKVMVVFNGAPENVVMLDMIRHGLEQEAFKKLRVDPVVVFVGEDFIGRDQEGYEQSVREKVQILRQFGFPAYYTVLGAQDSCSIEDNCLAGKFIGDQDKVTKVLQGIKSITSKQDFIVQTRKQTYKAIAKKLECGYIFLSSIGLELAKTLLSDVSLGRGKSLALDIAFCDDRDEERKIIRPMRDLNPEEIEYYLKFAENQLQSVAIVDPYLDKSSLQNLTSKFVDGLQLSFPSTVSTVFRTGDKLGAEKIPTCDNQLEDDDHFATLFDKSLKLESNAEEPRKCKFCHSALDYRDSTTLFATEFSRMVSSRINVQLSHEEIIESTKLMEQDACKLVNAELEDDEMRQLKRELCHACRNILVDFDGK
ncbi:cytoplasmic tRNA 2-thiolation protein 2 [Aedes aegypti]|uniref:Cytoplasmic tRNA 2-thiolation protein 2 n=1 Tax=Aedes aegypti TaxID=7159 RepID=A0A6I8T636_AEDAE|nr:cytoplasmic tRNA 2-thiolation protein 2 [Aedes aegypti]XP_021697830.1 cytoplasmic tRNA 2-thiolation protein 2 [Aedes aegypti]